MYDLKIRGGTVVDGTGRPRFVGDVGITDGRLVAVGDAPDAGRREIDASGKVVCPGFIDIHTHYDAQILWDRMLTVSPWYGVTTIVQGNCGFTIAPTRESDRDFILETLQEVEGMDYHCYSTGLGDWGFETFPQYLDLIERRGTVINVAQLIGHTAVRTYVLGEDANHRREATADELAQMQALVREAIQAGAAGFSTSNSPAHFGADGRPVVSRWTTFEELESLVMVLAELGTGSFESTWGAEMSMEGLERMLTETGVPLCNQGVQAREDPHILERIALAHRLQARGLPWFPQIQALPNTFEVGLEEPFMFALDQPPVFGVPGLNDLFVPIMQCDTAPERQAVYATPEFRRRFVEMTDTPEWNEKAWPWIVVNHAPGHPELEGRRLSEAAAAWGVPAAEVMLDLCLESDLDARFGSMTGNRSDRMLLEELFPYDGVRLGGSDAGAHQGMLCDARYPGFMLGHWVRERDFPLERAIRMMTTMEGECYGINDRGSLTPGLAADVVVFDPDTISDGQLRRVNDLPADGRRLIAEPTGIDYVVVNGTVIREHGVDAVDSEGPLPGTLLREFASHRERVGPLGAPLPQGTKTPTRT